MQKLQTVNAETLLYEPLEKPSFVVDSLIPTGLSLFCGSQKIGKSWLMLKLCLCVSQGIPLWDMPTMEGDVLYLCLEDTFCRIQDRLFRLTDEASGRLHFAVASCKLSDGLIVQLEDYLKDYPDSRLIVIDTLQKVRTASKDNAYASDYGDISLIKDFADRHSLAVIVVHHIRKQNDSDVFNKVSGTTGLTGSADATFVLEKEKRASDTAKLYVTGRDTPYQEYTLRFRDCRWELVERKTQEQLAKETIPDVLFRLVDFMRDKEEWIGTATELLAAMSSRWNQLERGQSSMETKRKHVPTWLYKLGGRLDKQYEEIVSALSDINAFNAGKKRDKALDLLSAWLPDVEKFSKEIGKQQAYIDSLKERIGQESDYAGRMRDEKYEQELKVQKANQKIFELQRTNEQMGRLLSKIPPEVLEELQKNHRSRAKER